MDEIIHNYISGTSSLHTLDPRTKLVVLMVVSIFILKTVTFLKLGMFFISFILLAYISGIGAGAFIRSIQPMMSFFIFIFLMHLFLTEGKSLFQLGLISPTFEGLTGGIIITTRFVLLILFSSLLTATTRSTMITNGIERLLRPLPLNRFGISSFDIATMMSLSIRFIPVLLDNARQIRYAQISRGLNTRQNIYRTASTGIVPMIRDSLKSADELAIAMESKCYQGNYRTSLFELKMRTSDWSVLCGVGMLVFLL